MESQSKSVRTVFFEHEELCYHLEWKSVKNLNLRIRKDGNVFLSANQQVPVRLIPS